MDRNIASEHSQHCIAVNTIFKAWFRDRTESILRDRDFTYKELFFSVVFLQEPLIIILLKLYDRVDRCIELMNLPKFDLKCLDFV